MPTVLTDLGEAHVIDAVDAYGTRYVGIGESATAPAKGDTNLGSPSTEARVAAVETQTSADVLQMVGTFTANGTKTLKEAGIFDAAGSGSPPSGGNLLIHGTFADAPVASGYTVVITVTLEIS